MLRIYFPDGYTSFEELPPNWNVNQPGYEGQTPSAYVIKVVPDSQIILKKKKTVDVILTPNVKSWIDKLRDIKEVHFEEISPEKEFFVNFENVPLKDQTSRRSVWYEFTQITGVTKMNLTKVRKGAEMNLRKNNKMTSVVENLNHHSNTVGINNYVLNGHELRSQYVVNLEGKECSSTEVPKASFNNEARVRERDLEDAELSKKMASEVLAKNRQKRSVKNERCKVTSDDREFMQNLITSSEHLQINKETKKKFPGDKRWKQLYYRLVDSDDLPDDVKATVRKIERNMFVVIKPEVEKETGTNWDNSSQQNKMADVKIASMLKKSFCLYERNNADNTHSTSYFKF